MLARDTTSGWPKRIPALSPELEEKRRAWNHYWLAHYPDRFSFVEKFTECFLRALPDQRHPQRILEIGPGHVSAVRRLMAADDCYSCCELDPAFCDVLRRDLPGSGVLHADVQDGIPAASESFDRVVAVHVLEHLPRLPPALDEIARVLRDDGRLDVVIPCEGSPLYTLGRRLTSAREFRKRFGGGFREIMQVEHVNRAREIVPELGRRFALEQATFFPFPLATLGVRANLLAGFRLRKAGRPT